MGRHTNRPSIKVLNERHFDSGYTIREEIWTFPGLHTLPVKMAYTDKGQWIGSSKLAHRLIVKHGIKPELADWKDSVCSIGFCEKEQRWYGWSHRALQGFGLGDMIFQEKYSTADGGHRQFRQCGKKMITTLDEAKQAAKNFARYVS